jgi:hypothetical protein
VPEVWIYANRKLQIYLLQSSGEYIQSQSSPIFPDLPIVEWIEEAIDQSWTIGSLEALKEIETRYRSIQTYYGSSPPQRLLIQQRC